MADLQISIGARDEASPAFKAVGDSGKKMGEEVKKGALTAEEALLEQYRAMEKLQRQGEELARLQSKYGNAATSHFTTLKGAAQAAQQSLARANTSMSTGLQSVGGAAEEAGALTGAGMAAVGAAAAVGALALSKVYEVSKQGVEDFIEAEKADQQLAAAVKQLGYNVDRVAPALSNLGEELENQTLVSAETIKQVEQLFLRYGVAPKDIEKTTKAVLDFAAASGKDANTAAQLMIRAMSGSGQEMQAFGVSVKRTGDSTKDLNALVDQMTDKFGGSAAAATEGMAGSIGRLEKAESDLGKAWGGFIVQVEQKLGVVKTLTTFMNELNDAVFGNQDQKSRQAALDQNAALNTKIAQLKTQLTEAERILDQLQDAAPGATMQDSAGGVMNADAALARVMKLTAALDAAEKAKKDLKEKWDGIKGVGQSGAAAAAQAATDALNKGTNTQVAAVDDGGRKLAAAFAKNEKALHDKMVRDINHIPEDALRYAWQVEEQKQEEQMHLMFERLKHARDREDAEFQRLLGQSRNRMGQLSVAVAKSTEEQGSDAMYDAGITVGGAFVSGLDQALSETQSGGDFDVGALVASVLPALVTAGIIASTGGAAAPFAPLIGAAAGIIVKQGIGALTPKAQGAPQKKFHSGGWVDLPRYHDGGLAADEHPAILQAGERVLSRNEVAAMGGPSGVDAAASGGGRTAVFIQTFDALSMRDMAAGRMGTSIVRTTMQGRGEFQMQLARMGFGKRRRS